MDMQVTFDSGLETLGERLASKKGSKAAETLWQAYEKRRRYLPTPDQNLTTRQPAWHTLIITYTWHDCKCSDCLSALSVLCSHWSKSRAVSGCLCREKRQAAKRMGKHHASSSEDESDGAPSGDEGAGAEEVDPFFAPEEDPFSDPFFQVYYLLSTVPYRACNPP